MNESKRKPIATIAVTAFMLLASACSQEAGDTAAPAVAQEAATDVYAATTESVEAAAEEPEQVETQVQGIAEEAAVEASNTAGQRFEIVGVPRGLNLRSGPGVSYQVIQGIEKDRIVASTGTEQGGWAEVTIDGLTGWVTSLHLQSTDAFDNPVELESTSEVAATGLIVVNVPAGLNLRAGPGVGYDIVGGATLGTLVTPTGQRADSWVEVDHAGVVGWASETHLAQG